MEQMRVGLNERNLETDGKERWEEKNGENQDELISVIICTYNRVGLLGRSIQSVLSQTYTNLELLIIDDCSADDTGEFVKKISDERIRYYRNEKNMGIAASRNRGASLAKGEYLAFQDDDDEWKPEKLARLMEVWKKEAEAGGETETGKEAAVIYHEMQEQGKNTFIPSRDIPPEWKSKDIFRHMLLYPMIGATASLIRKSCLDELGGFNAELKSIEDYEFYLRVAKKYRILFVGEPLMIIYDTPGSVNKRFKSKIDTELYILDTMYDSLCQYDILQKKVNLIRLQAENYECEEYFYEQLLRLCEQERDAVKGAEIKNCLRKGATVFREPQRGDRSTYYQNAAGQIGRLTESLKKLQNNLRQNPSMLAKNRRSIYQALGDVIRDMQDYTDLAIYPRKEKEILCDLEKHLQDQSQNVFHDQPGKHSQNDHTFLTILKNLIQEAEELMRQIGASKCICSVCGSEVRFLPLSPYGKVMRKHYGFTRRDVKFLFEDEERDQCPVCKASQKDRFLLGFLEDIQPESNEKLKILCMRPEGKAWDQTGNRDGSQSDSQDSRTTTKYVEEYAEKRNYLEYIVPKPDQTNMGKADVVICKDILEQSPDELTVLKEMYGRLADDGVGIVMVSALLMENNQEVPLDLSALAGKEGNTNNSEAENFRKFGLEDICRLYSENDWIRQFDQAGFDTQIADMEWFGGEYYEQYGFSDTAQIFILTKKPLQK